MLGRRVHHARVYDLHGPSKLLGGQLPDPGSTIANHHDLLGAVVTMLVRQCAQQRGKGFCLAQSGDIGAGTNPSVFAVLVLIRFVNHAILALAKAAGQISLARVFLPWVTKGHEHAIQTNVEPLEGFRQNLSLMLLSLLVLVGTQKGPNDNTEPLDTGGRKGYPRQHLQGRGGLGKGQLPGQQSHPQATWVVVLPLSRAKLWSKGASVCWQAAQW
jgi:hypothetical protein